MNCHSLPFVPAMNSTRAPHLSTFGLFHCQAVTSHLIWLVVVVLFLSNVTALCAGKREEKALYLSGTCGYQR